MDHAHQTSTLLDPSDVTIPCISSATANVLLAPRKVSVLSHNSSAQRLLSESEVAAYQCDGYVIVHNLYAEEEMLTWKEIVRRNVDSDDPAVRAATYKSGVRVWMAEDFDPYLLEAMRDKAVLSILNQLIGPSVEFLSAKAVFKSSDVGFGSPWHQDWQYWHGATKISVWIALDHASRDNGCLKVLPGSHTAHLSHTSQQYEEGFDNRIAPNQVEESRAVTAAVTRGSAIFFHDMLAHSSFPNASGQDRWSFISTYRSGAVKDDANVWQHPLVVSGESVNAP